MRNLFWLSPLLLLLGGSYALSALSLNDQKQNTVEIYGVMPKDTKPTTVQAILEAPDDYRNQTRVVTGYVRQACTKKGCWMELASSSQNKDNGVRVTFKNYGFFVPIDSRGAHARIEGLITIKKLSTAAVRHYEKEGASFHKKNQDGSAHEISIVATGVELTKSTSS